jgi:hypothetical protein
MSRPVREVNLSNLSLLKFPAPATWQCKRAMKKESWQETGKKSEKI